VGRLRHEPADALRKLITAVPTTGERHEPIAFAALMNTGAVSAGSPHRHRYEKRAADDIALFTVGRTLLLAPMPFGSHAFCPP
jgi:hypothetical protein